eukprot:TRINITY_DN563_c0_g1_i1.p1 TRINITY_DN563_c0_g1~~TRINITY_DN563_c0_g1_i1.p1  ORF type:complete len:219 (-),score=90.25 TRINITY_DN563_c0_g1_i1:179-835(-)
MSDTAAAPATTEAPSTTTPVEKKDEVKIEDVTEDSDMPSLETAPAAPAAVASTEEAAQTGKAKQSKSEKKSRKAIAKLGMKPVPGIIRVTVKKAKSILFVISSPDVYKSPASDTYVVFGEAKIEDFSGQNLSDTVGGLDALAGAGGDATFGAPTEEPPALEQVEGASTEAPAGGDEDGVAAKDIELVMSQTSVSRAQAIAALKKSNGDIVGAIMQLTM